MTLSPLDDYPVHQIPEVMRHVGTSDRNFYDRYYFNAFPLTARVGPFRVEVLEGLKRLRVVLGPNEFGLAFDLTWEGTIPPQVEPRHFVRAHERVVFDSKRMAQTGRWHLGRPAYEPAYAAGTRDVVSARIDLSRPQDAARMRGMVDAVGRFEYEGRTGYGLYEYWALGDHPSFR